MEDGHGVFDGRLRSHALDGLDDDSLGLFVGSHLGLFDNLIDVCRGLSLGFIFEAFHQSVFSLGSGESAQRLQMSLFASFQLVEFRLFLFNHRELSSQILTHQIHFLPLLRYIFLTLVEGLFAAFEFALHRLELAIALCYLLFQVAFQLEKFLFHFEELLLLDYLGFTASLGENPLCPLLEQCPRDQPYGSGTGYKPQKSK